MSDIQPTADPEEVDAPVRYVLQRLPDPQMEKFQRGQHRSQKYLNTAMFVLMLFMVVWSVGMVGLEVAYGDGSTVSMAALLLVYTVALAWTVFQGNAGVRGRYHQVHAHNCAIALEDDQRGIFGYDNVHSPLGNIPAELVPEYLRLLRLSSDSSEYVEGLRDRLDQIKFDGVDLETDEADPVAKEDHVD